jgi:hypothetical protein
LCLSPERYSYPVPGLFATFFIAASLACYENGTRERVDGKTSKTHLAAGLAERLSCYENGTIPVPKLALQLFRLQEHMSEKKLYPKAREKKPYTCPAFVTFRPDAVQAKKMAETFLPGSDDECLKLITEMKSHGMGVVGSGDPRKPGKNNG